MLPVFGTGKAARAAGTGGLRQFRTVGLFARRRGR